MEELIEYLKAHSDLLIIVGVVIIFAVNLYSRKLTKRQGSDQKKQDSEK